MYLKKENEMIGINIKNMRNILIILFLDIMILCFKSLTV